MELLTLREAADLLAVRPDTLRAQIHRGRLTASKLGRDWVVDRGELERYRVQSHRAVLPSGPQENETNNGRRADDLDE